MRFVLTLSAYVCACALLSSPALSAPWDIAPLSNKNNQSNRPTRAVQMQRGGSSNDLQTIGGLDLVIAASGLGSISAVALGKDGTLFTADAKSGRIWALTDRRQDGEIDLRRPLPFTFDNPTAVTVINDTLYVADNNAVWVIEKEQAPKELASLKQIPFTGAPRHLISTNGSTILLGLTSSGQSYKILELDKKTGQASLLSEGNDGPLHSLGQLPNSDIWAGTGTAFGAVGSNGVSFTSGQSITAMALPGQYQTPQDWPAQLKGHILAVQAGENAMRIIAMPTEFGQLSGAPRVFVEGFLTRSGRSAWGQPGPMVMDKRGLFFADAHNGTVWRLSPTPKPQPKITIVDTASLPFAPSPEPNLAEKGGALKIESTITGTQINTTSNIGKSSSIEYGSKLIKDYDEKKAKEDAEKAETEPKKKKRRNSRNRKQKDE